MDSYNKLLKHLELNLMTMVNKNLIVGFSGGIDSTLILYLLNSLKEKYKFNLEALYVNHNLSLNSNDWQKFCEETCKKLSIKFSSLSVNLKNTSNIEQQARLLRYECYSKFKDFTVILGHHSSDLLETMVSQLIRGSDIHNVAGMSEFSQKNEQIFWRPMLNIVNKEEVSEIFNYIKFNNIASEISHIHDESNNQNIYLRNLIRNEIFPKLKNLDHNYEKRLMSSVKKIKESVKLIDDLAQIDLINCEFIKNSLLLKLNINKIKNISIIRFKNLIMYLFKKEYKYSPKESLVEELYKFIQTNKKNKAIFTPLNIEINKNDLLFKK